MSVVSLPDDKSVKLVPHVHGVDPRDPRLRVDQRGPRLRVDTEGPVSTGWTLRDPHLRGGPEGPAVGHMGERSARPLSTVLAFNHTQPHTISC